MYSSCIVYTLLRRARPLYCWNDACAYGRVLGEESKKTLLTLKAAEEVTRPAVGSCAPYAAEWKARARFPHPRSLAPVACTRGSSSLCFRWDFLFLFCLQKRERLLSIYRSDFYNSKYLYSDIVGHVARICYKGCVFIWNADTFRGSFIPLGTAIVRKKKSIIIMGSVKTMKTLATTFFSLKKHYWKAKMFHLSRFVTSSFVIGINH